MEQGSFDFCCFVFLSVCAYARAAATGFAMPGLIPDWFGLQLPSLQVLDLRSSLPSASSVARWFGEPVRAAIINTNSFLTNAKEYPCLSKRHQRLTTAFFDHSVQFKNKKYSVHDIDEVRHEWATFVQEYIGE